MLVCPIFAHKFVSLLFAFAKKELSKEKISEKAKN
jgi:hypothetical protein